MEEVITQAKNNLVCAGFDKEVVNKVHIEIEPISFTPCLSCSQFGKLVGKHKESIRQLVLKGVIKANRFDIYYIPIDELIKFVNKC